jgi:hypothetical protein
VGTTHLFAVRWQLKVVVNVPAVQETVVWLGVYVEAHCAVQVPPLPAMAAVFAPSAQCWALALAALDIAAVPWHVVWVSQLKVAKVPEVHNGVATLGVYPVAQAAVHVEPLLIEVRPEQTPVAAPLVMVVPALMVVNVVTVHASGLQTGVGKAPPVDGHCTVAAAVCPVAQFGVQVPPAPIETTPTPQCPVAKVAPQLVGTTHLFAVRWQLKVVVNAPAVQETVVWLGVYVEAHCAVQVPPLPAMVAVFAPSAQYWALALAVLDIAAVPWHVLAVQVMVPAFPALHVAAALAV